MTPQENSSPAPSASSWVSPYQMAMARLLAAILALLYLGFFPLEVLEGASTSAWLELPRLARGFLRLGAFLIGFLLLTAWFRRLVGAALVCLLTVMSVYGRIDAVVAGTLGVALVAALSQSGDDPLGLPPFSPKGDEARPVPYFTRLIWPWLSLPIVVGLLRTHSPIATLLGLLIGGGSVFITVRGARRSTAVTLLGAWAVGLWVASGVFALPVWVLLALLCLSREWLPPRTAVIAPHEDPTALDDPEPPIVFYDGVCGLCQSSIQLIVAEDKDARLMHAPLQGETARRLLGVSPDQEFDSLKLHDSGIIYERSTGALRIAGYLGGFWTAVSWCERIPAPFRDAVYDFVAKNRYAWFGKLEACRIPTPAERQRFLD